MTKKSTPSIFEYKNYRDYLRDVYDSLKADAESQFTFRRFAQEAGYSSPSVLKLVIDGKRNLSSESIQKFAKALKLNREETAFFSNLVFLNQAKTLDEKRHYAQLIVSAPKYRKIHPLKTAQFDYFTRWYFAAIRELVATEGFLEDPDWISEQLSPSISSGEAKSALEKLLQLGLLVRDEHGRLRQSERALESGDDVVNASLAQFHREMIQKASESIERFPGAEREISSLTFGVDEETALKLKEMLQKFRAEVAQLLLDSRKDCSSVYQMNFQLFPLTKKKSKKEAA